MSTAELRTHIHSLVDRISDNNTLQVIYTILSRMENGATTTLTKEEKQAVDEAFKSIELGKTHTHEDVMKEMRAKYPDIVK